MSYNVFIGIMDDGGRKRCYTAKLEWLRQSLPPYRRERKVRAPQGKTLDNVQLVRTIGKCHRNQTARFGE